LGIQNNKQQDKAMKGVIYVALIVVITMGFLVERSLFAQPPDTLWTRTFGGGNDDYGEFVRQSMDGGYIIAGWSFSYGAGNGDIWLIKTDANGDSLWTRTFGGNANDCGTSVEVTTDGGYIVGGYTRSYGTGSSDIWLIKTDSLGDEQWSRTFGGSDGDYGYSVQQTSDRGYIVVGFTESYGSAYDAVWLIKTDSLGNEQWNRTFGGSDHDRGYSVQQTYDGGYIVGGATSSYGAGEWDIWLIKTDSVGNEQWNRTFGGSAWDYGYSAQQTADGEYIVVGFTESYGCGGRDVWVIKVDSLGNEKWNSTIGGMHWDVGYNIQQTGDGGFIITGYTGSWTGPYYDVLMIRLGRETYIETGLRHYFPKEFTLYLPYPNPFNAITTVSFDVPHGSHVTMKVYNILGQEVAVLVDGWLPGGHHKVSFDGADLASGVYFYELTAPGFCDVRKMVLMK
jgi:hypothetical protein